jgi:potassium-transporting ATPase KdpC subunit
MLRRQLLSGLLMTIAMIVLVGVLYPLAVLGVSQLFMSDRADGSLVKNAHGQVVGSSLIGQNFTDKDGNALPQYFQPRPSKAGDGYDALASAGSNLAPSNANLIGNVPNVAWGDDNKPITSNPDATPQDPYCVAVQPGEPQGTPGCDPNTVPQRAIAYRTLNGLPPNSEVPSDAVTASGSGLDPQISLANARLQAARVAKARNLPINVVTKAIADHTQGRQLGVLGEQTVNVLELNLALDRMT